MFSFVRGVSLWNGMWVGATSAKVNVAANVIGVGALRPATILSVQSADCATLDVQAPTCVETANEERAQLRERRQSDS